MRAPLAAIAFLALLSPAHAAVHLNPDPNTLWIEDGLSIEAGPGTTDKHWSSDKMDFRLRPEGGLTFAASEEPKKTSTGRNLPVNKDYPYMVLEIVEVAKLPKGNRGFSAPKPFKPGFLGMGMGGDVQNGVWTFNMLAASPKFHPQEFYRLDCYGNQVTVKYIKMVREPDFLVQVDSPVLKTKDSIDIGDDITFRVKLKQDVEDVTVTLFHAYRMLLVTLNGQTRFQLKPEGEEAKVWSCSVPLKTLQMDKNGGPLNPGILVVKATILGGGPGVPVWGVNHTPVAVAEK
ncbi:MAG TPA: hypothetical protein P5137_03585 [Candidatus Brocadiia bacterium]|nr:hypothetical protein [Candidatus Brocadiia bacterium]